MPLRTRQFLSHSIVDRVCRAASPVVSCFQSLANTVVRGGGVVTHFRYHMTSKLAYPIRNKKSTEVRSCWHLTALAVPTWCQLVSARQIHAIGRYVGMYFVAGPATARQVSVTCRDSKDVTPKPSSLPSFLRRLSDCIS